MALREKFGKLVLLEETGAGALGLEYRAARLGPAGLDRLVTVLRFGPEVSSNAEATKRLMDEARLAARLQNPGLVRVLGIGRVEQSVYVSTELVEGRSVAAILDRCRGEAFPFAADHALMIASRAAVALEFLHGKKDDAGASLSHGLVAPSRLVVAFDGEVKLKGLGLWPALRGTDLLPAEERRYLAPEQVAGEAGEARSDVYALGLVLLEALTGQAPDGTDPLDGLAAARVTGTTGEQGPLPKPLAELLRRALGREPAERFSGMADLRKAIDALLFSGDFTPTTFDLAFFMHTLFREDMEREARALEEARRGDYGEFLAEEKRAVPAPAATEPDSGPAAAPRRRPRRGGLAPRRRPPRSPAPTLADSARAHRARAAVSRARGPGRTRSGSRPAASRVSREAAAREAASRMTLGATAVAPGGRRGLWLLLGLLAAVVVGGGAGWVYFVKLRSSSPSPAPGADAAAAPGARARARGEDRPARAREGRGRDEGGGGGAPDRRGPGRDRGKARRPRGGGAGAGGGASAGAGRAGGTAAGGAGAASPRRRRPRSSGREPRASPRRRPRQRQLPRPRRLRRRPPRPLRRPYPTADPAAGTPRRHPTPTPAVPSPAPPTPSALRAARDPRRGERPDDDARRCSSEEPRSATRDRPAGAGSKASSS